MVPEEVCENQCDRSGLEIVFTIAVEGTDEGDRVDYVAVYTGYSM